MIPIPYVLLALGILIVAVSVPLVAQMVPMNRWYGIRTRKAFASEDNWYELNAYGGKLLLAFGAFVVLIAVVGFFVAPDPTSIWAPVFLCAPLVVIIPVVALINARGRRLPG